MDDATIDVMEAMRSCRCCLVRPPDKGLKTLYTHLGKTEIYSDMLKDCLNIHMQLILGDDECGICELCVCRLRDASEFKDQVQRSQALLEKALHVKDQKPCIKLERPTSPDMSNEGTVECAVAHLGKFEITVEEITPSQEPSSPSESVSEKDQASHTCQTCWKTFDDEAALTNHMRDHTKQEIEWQQQINYNNIRHPTDIYKCDICEALFTKKFSLAKHIQEDHKKNTEEKRHACHLCQQKFKHKTHLKTHLQTHMGIEVVWFPCEMCNLQFNNKTSLTKHMRMHKDAKRRYYPCDVCEKQLASQRTLIAHKRIHAGEKAYPNQPKKPKFRISDTKRPICCEVCGKVFRNNSAFSQHMNSHTGLRPYSCDICHKRFTQRGCIKAHKLKHTGEKPFACKICQKPFGLRTTLRDHMIVHSEERKHSCKMCNKQFKHKAALVTHIKLTHSERKPYSCSICYKAFALQCLLKRHMLIHTGEKPFQCDTCNKGFTTKSQLKKHLTIHLRQMNAI